MIILEHFNYNVKYRRKKKSPLYILFILKKSELEENNETTMFNPLKFIFSKMNTYVMNNKIKF
jgi:hypothetical protein